MINAKLIKSRPLFLDDYEQKMRTEKTFEIDDDVLVSLTGTEDYPVSHRSGLDME